MSRHGHDRPAVVSPPGCVSPSGWCVGVVVPACNEEQTIEACIDSIVVSLDSCRGVESSWIVVVADSCSDRTVARARARLGGRGAAIECSAASPGVARRLGVGAVLERFDAQPAAHLWIANTDADSQPDADWIARQLALADQDYCGVAGIVRIESTDAHRPEVVRAFLADYTLNADGTHPHVHGANLGIRADAYLDSGGWSNLPLAEDHCLWSRVRARGWRVVSSIASVVTTSGRLRGRASGGFADSLRRKAELLCA
jgi:cellulose synthase/poly-beta-1,6-N-acetylglucosamine synthase-like glycosyltransferase